MVVESVESKAQTPSGMDIFKVFQTVLAKWAYLPSEYAGAAAPKPLKNGLVFSVALHSDFEALLVVKGPRLMGSLLSEAAGGGVIALTSEDSFQEMVNVFCGHLLSALWPGRRFGVFLPVLVSEKDLPQDPPLAACAVTVESYPVEILVWMRGPSPLPLS